MLINLRNTSYKLSFSNSSEKYLKKLRKRNKEDFDNLLNSIKSILNDPYDSKLLHGKFEGLRRIKYSNYRIVFFINNESNPQEILIIEIGKRKNIYK